MEELREQLNSLDKAELHVHLEGTVTPKTLSELAVRNNVSLESPIFVGEEVFSPPAGAGSTLPELNNFPEFIAYYLKISECIQSAEDVEFVILRYAEEAVKEGVSHAEVYFSPTTFELFNRELGELFIGLKRGQENALRDHGARIRWIFDVVRNASRDGSEVLEIAAAAKKTGVDVAAIGLAGYEAPFPAKPFAETFKRAKGLGFATLAHAGETAGPESVRETIEHLQPLRIGHGVCATQDPSLIAELAELQIPIEVCPYSNIALKVFNKDQHPIAQMISAGLNIVIASDDPGIFGKSLVDNYLFAAKQGVGSAALERLAKNSLAQRIW